MGVRPSGEAGERLSAEGCRDGSCIIRLDTVARITDRDGRIPELAFFERDSAGQIWVTGYTRDHMLRVDPATGEFAAVGQAGSGPGEFRRVGIPLMAPGDSLHLYDMSLLRSTVIGPDFEVARIYSLSHPPTLRLNDGASCPQG